MKGYLINFWKIFVAGFLLMSLIICSSGIVFAAPDAAEILQQEPSVNDFPEENAVIMLDKTITELTEEGKIITEYKARIKVFTRQGRKEYGEIRIPFSSELSNVELNYARTINQDGSVTKPDKEAIRVNTHPLAKGAPMYSDIKIKTISMPALKNDSIIDYSYTRTSKTLMEDSLFSQWYFKTSAPVLTSEYTVKIPAEKELSFKSINGNHEPKFEKKDGKKVYRWHQKDLDKIYNEAGRPSINILSPKLIISTEKDWQVIAEWYGKLIDEKNEPDLEIKNKVEEIVEGLESEEEKIAKIFDFVATKIRYVALEFGLGKVQPYSVNKTFKNKYGDCKDQASLLATMLREAGIDAYLTLIKAGQAKKTYFEGPATLGGFNHAITAVNLENSENFIFLDPTCDVCNWEYLPDQNRGRQVMIIKDRKGIITETPPYKYKENKVKTEMEVEINKKGDIEVTIDMEPDGKWAYVYRSLFQSYDKSEKRKLFQQILSQHISAAKLGDIEHSDPEDNFSPFTLHLTYKKAGYATQTAGMTIFKVPNSLRIPFSQNFSYYTSKEAGKRKYPVLMTPATYNDRIVINIPEDTEVKLPEKKNIENNIAAFSSSYSKEEKKIIITRKFQIKTNMLDVNKSYKQGKQVINVMRSDEEEKIVLD